MSCKDIALVSPSVFSTSSCEEKPEHPLRLHSASRFLCYLAGLALKSLERGPENKYSMTSLERGALTFKPLWFGDERCFHLSKKMTSTAELVLSTRHDVKLAEVQSQPANADIANVANETIALEELLR